MRYIAEWAASIASGRQLAATADTPPARPRES